MQILKRPNQKMHDNAPLVEPMITDTSQSNEVFRDIIFPREGDEGIKWGFHLPLPTTPQIEHFRFKTA